MTPNTTDAARKFVTISPDWKMSVRYWVTHSTDVHRAYDQTEQRTANRSYPRCSIAYGRTYAANEWPARRAALLNEFGQSLVVPIWTRPDSYVSAAGDVVTIDATTVLSPYKVGSYAYFEETGLASVFRQITALDGDEITFAAGNAAFPVMAVPAYTAAALVYPCIIGLRQNNEAEWSEDQVDQAGEVLFFEEQ